MTDEWKTMISDYSGTIAVGGTGKLYIFWLLAAKKPLILDLPRASASNAARFGTRVHALIGPDTHPKCLVGIATRRSR